MSQHSYLSSGKMDLVESRSCVYFWQLQPKWPISAENHGSEFFAEHSTETLHVEFTRRANTIRRHGRPMTCPYAYVHMYVLALRSRSR